MIKQMFKKIIKTYSKLHLEKNGTLPIDEITNDHLPVILKMGKRDVQIVHCSCTNTNQEYLLLRKKLSEAETKIKPTSGINNGDLLITFENNLESIQKLISILQSISIQIMNNNHEAQYEAQSKSD